MKTSILSILLFTWFSSIGQTIDYNDVAVIVNDNSQTSIDIGNYFQNARNIPNQNMIHVSAPTTEAIDSAQFELIRAQIESYLLNNNLADSINYLVTTKGVPLKIDASCFDTIPSTFACASFDSELCLILSSDSNQIGGNSHFSNSYFQANQNFSRENYGIYLVTRLTGYTKQDVFNLIDRSGFETGLNQSSAQAILDLNYCPSADSSYFADQYVLPTEAYLNSISWNNQIHLDLDPYLNQTNVFAYHYYASGPIPNISLNYDWTEGSIATMEVFGTAGTFDPAQITNGNFGLADLISEGCTGGHGFVYGNFFSFIMDSETLLDYYLSTVTDYNLAESFYASEPRVSWQAVVVGDPKASVVIDNTASLSEPEELNVRMYPNPTSGFLTIESSDVITNVQLYGINGALVKSIDANSTSSINLDLTELTWGVYLAHIYSEDKVRIERIVLTK